MHEFFIFRTVLMTWHETFAIKLELLLDPCQASVKLHENVSFLYMHSILLSNPSFSIWYNDGRKAMHFVVYMYLYLSSVHPIWYVVISVKKIDLVPIVRFTSKVFYLSDGVLISAILEGIMVPCIKRYLNVEPNCS